MPVAPSFQNMPVEGEPFMSNGKQYVKVKNEKTGKIRTVRYYNEKEYAKLYPETPVANDPFYKTQRELLGFGEKGYVVAFKGDTYSHKDYLKSAGARYTRWFGWTFPSEEDMPADFPTELVPVRLYWEGMCRNNEWLANDDEIKEYVESQMYEPSDSEFVGEIGERLDLYISIEKIIPLNNEYGHSTLFVMIDDCGNVYNWITASAKTWKVGEEKHIRGTVKQHKTYKNDKTTVLTRCTEVKK